MLKQLLAPAIVDLALHPCSIRKMESRKMKYQEKMADGAAM
jgi:hypothetical protein